MLKPEVKTVKLSNIIFDEIIYPRKNHDPILVQRYVDVLDEIEAAQRFISVSSDMKLLDGKHRWLAYRKRSDGQDIDVNVLVYPISAPHEQLKIAAKLNSDHGKQLNEQEKESTAKSLYAYGSTYEDIAASLSVGKKKVSDWLSRTVKDEKVKRNARILELWMACNTQEEIAAREKVDQHTVRDILGKEFLNTESLKPAASHQTDFDPPIYNVWKIQTKTEGSKHFGNSEIKWLDNLLYLYTNPLDIVVDPFAGSGSTVDLCKKRFRRYWASDRKPIVEREQDIRQHDLTDGLPQIPRWKDVKLVYLDPPYWKQAEGQYSDSPNDLANMTLEDFNKNLSGIISQFSKKLQAGSFIALIIQPTQWKSPEREFTDHIGDMLRMVKLPVEMRYSVPYESQQNNAQMVIWAKENKKCLVLTREIIVWRIV